MKRKPVPIIGARQRFNDAAFIRDWTSGMTLANMSKKYRVNTGTIYRQVDRLGLERRNGPKKRRGPYKWVKEED